MRWLLNPFLLDSNALILRLARLRDAIVISTVFSVVSATSVASTPLSLEEAVSVVKTRVDPLLLRHDERVNALEDRAIADSQLPDPELQFGFTNWPVESFDYEQEPMTQIRAGIRQRFPKGKSLSVLGERKKAEAAIETARRALGVADIVLETKRAWYELYYLSFAKEIVQQSRGAVAELVDVVQASFATGLQNNQDLLRAELELSLLDDRALDIEQRIQEQSADLARFVGNEADRPIAKELPVVGSLPTVEGMHAALVRHPSVAIQDALIAVADSDVRFAEEQYKPGFSLDAGYGARGGDRADFASIMLSVQVPLFPEKRQDKVLTASEQERTAAKFERDSVLLELRRRSLRVLASVERLTNRVGLYQDVVINRADGAAIAALDGYQNQVSDFAELIRSRLSALETTLKLRRLEAELGQAHASLDFLMGRP